MGSTDLGSRLRAAAADLAALEPAVLGARPWPLALRFDHSDESSWGPPEILAHVDEMLPYWLGEAERVLEADPAQPPAFGRTATDDVRIAIIARDRTLPLRELFARARSSAERVADRIDGLTEGELDRAGRHAARGPMPVVELFDRYLVSHLEEHVRQLRDVLVASGRLPTA